MMNSAYDKWLYPSFTKAHFFPRHKPPTSRPPAFSVNIYICRALGRSENMGGQLLIKDILKGEGFTILIWASNCPSAPSSDGHARYLQTIRPER